MDQSPYQEFLSKAERVVSMDSRARIFSREQAVRNEIQEFLQIHHTQFFHVDFLHRYLEIPIRDVEQICETLITLGAAYHPEGTGYMQGVAVDWEAVHAGRAPWPDWALGYFDSPDPLENCQHTDSVRWNANRGRFECGQCNEPQEIPELLEALTPELKQPYDVVIEL
jgi:hypothetical protein